VYAYTSEHGLICQDCLDDLRLYGGRNWREPSGNDIVKTRDMKQSLATYASYLTLTRHADLAMRTIVGPRETEEVENHYGYDILRKQGIVSLIFLGIIFHLSVAMLVGIVFWSR
jgi:hypothetical protein